MMEAALYIEKDWQPTYLILEDWFIYQIILYEDIVSYMKIFKFDTLPEIYLMYEDNTQWLLESEEDLHEHNDNMTYWIEKWFLYDILNPKTKTDA